ncbi:MAG: NTP transferase domain-containing protein [Geobacter sp.]|nr:NTP transferase domain-containing protein [Geobacter sp.]
MCGQVNGVSGIILAGGESRRMGRDKALLELNGSCFIESVYRVLSELFPEVIIVTNNPERYAFLSCRLVPDLYPGKGALAGIHAGLLACKNDRAFVTACDMPFLHAGLIRYLAQCAADVDAIVPRTPDGLQPLHAIYHFSSLPIVEQHLRSGDVSILKVLAAIRTLQVPAEELQRFDPDLKSFSNINTPGDFSSIVPARTPR